MDSTTLQTEVLTFLDGVRQSWDNADAHTYSQQFAENATYIIFMVDTILGRHQIEETHREVFNKWQKGTRLIVKPISIQPLSDNTVSVVTVGGLAKVAKLTMTNYKPTF